MGFAGIILLATLHIVSVQGHEQLYSPCVKNRLRLTAEDEILPAPSGIMTPDDCDSACISAATCDYFNFDFTYPGTCRLFSGDITSGETDVDQGLIMSGAARCTSAMAPEDKVLPIIPILVVAGGFNAANVERTEAIPLDASSFPMTCRTMEWFSLDDGSLTSLGGVPVIVGGEQAGSGDYSPAAKIYDLATDSWIQLANMNGGRTMSGGRTNAFSVAVNENEFWVTGGYNGHAWDSQLYSSVTGMFEDSFRLPTVTIFGNGWYGHCLAKVNEHEYILHGGMGDRQLAYKLEVVVGAGDAPGEPGTPVWTQLPSSTQRQEVHGCGVVTNPTTTHKEFVIYGGEYPTPEILDLDTLIWRNGAALAPKRKDTISTPYKDTFLVISGKSGGNIYLTDILEYNPAIDGFETRAETLTLGREDLSAVVVGSDTFPFCMADRIPE